MGDCKLKKTTKTLIDQMKQLVALQMNTHKAAIIGTTIVEQKNKNIFKAGSISISVHSHKKTM